MGTKTNFDVYFEFYGKKMKVKVLADNQFEAESIVRKQIKIHKIEKSKDDFNSVIDMFKDLLK